MSTGYVTRVDEIKIHPKYSLEVPNGKLFRSLQQITNKMSVFVVVSALSLIPEVLSLCSSFRVVLQ
jgi:hypothetical protein